MNPAVVSSGAPAIRPLALACALAMPLLSAFAPVSAAAQDLASTVVITGARFPSDAALQPIGATVITQDAIRRAGVNDVNAAIRKIGGVYGRQSLDSSPDFTLDLRGFGTNSAQNMVILVDGVRLSENEQTNASLAAIPIDTVERIEITRGGGSVLYGDGATGGVIQIITRAGTKQGAQQGMHGSVFAEGGEFHQHDVRVALTQVSGDITADVAVARQGSQNYRDNAAYDERNFSVGLQTRFNGGRVGMRVESAQQETRFPGPLTQAQFEQHPTMASTLQDFGSLDTNLATAFAEYRLGPVELAAELAHRERSVRAAYVSGAYPSTNAYDGRQDQFSPRARWLGSVGGMLNEAVAGIDLARWKRKTDSSYSNADASQTSRAVYLRDELRFDAAHEGRLALGARHETFDKDFTDELAFATPDHAKQSQNAWEAQASYKPLPLLGVYAKAGQSYRVPNVDDNAFRFPVNALLKVQTSHDLELGATLSNGSGDNKLTARLFRHKLDNEIFYDPTAGAFGANTNLDPTRRQGVEIDAETRIAADWHASAHLQHVNAAFTEGPNAGRELVLVPKNVVTARLAWLPAGGQSADVGVQWVDRQRNGNDFDNSCAARMPSYVTFDARYAVKVDGWEIAATGLNLADRQYYSNAYGCGTGIYPSNGRQLKVSARYDF
jgi:iron complex outermembrane receptor protein